MSIQRAQNGSLVCAKRTKPNQLVNRKFCLPNLSTQNTQIANILTPNVYLMLIRTLFVAIRATRSRQKPHETRARAFVQFWWKSVFGLFLLLCVIESCIWLGSRGHTHKYTHFVIIILVNKTDKRWTKRKMHNRSRSSAVHSCTPFILSFNLFVQQGLLLIHTSSSHIARLGVLCMDLP